MEYYVWIFEHSNMWNSDDAMDSHGNIYEWLRMHKMILESFEREKNMSPSGTQTRNSRVFYIKKKRWKNWEYISFCVGIGVDFLYAVDRAGILRACGYGSCIKLHFIKILLYLKIRIEHIACCTYIFCVGLCEYKLEFSLKPLDDTCRMYLVFYKHILCHFIHKCCS